MKMQNKAIRSPFFYVGDKYKLMTQLRELFPDNISTYVEPFAGGGSSFLNTEAKKYIVNDKDSNVIRLHEYLSQYANNREVFFDKAFNLIEKYQFSCSLRGNVVPDDIKEKYKKTYYSQWNRNSYEALKKDFNKNHDMLSLYLLLIYGFNHMIRFNKAGEFNLPVGNVDFNNNVYVALNQYFDFIERSEIEFFNVDFMPFLKSIIPEEGLFVYLDPPYLISESEYNKNWNKFEEKRLYDSIDDLNRRGIYFGITNLVEHKGTANSMFIEWSKKYYVYDIKSNYISFNDNTIKDDSREVFVTNYGKE